MLNRLRIIFHKYSDFYFSPSKENLQILKQPWKKTPSRILISSFEGRKTVIDIPKRILNEKKKKLSVNRRNQNISPPEGCNVSFVLFSSSINFSKTHTILKLCSCLGSDGERKPAALHQNSFWYSSNSPSTEASLDPAKHACQSPTSYIKNTAVSWLPSTFRIKSQHSTFPRFVFDTTPWQTHAPVSGLTA